MMRFYEIEARSFTTSSYNKFTGEILIKKVKQKMLLEKSDIYGFLDNSDLVKKTVATIETKTKLKA